MRQNFRRINVKSGIEPPQVARSGGPPLRETIARVLRSYGLSPRGRSESEPTSVGFTDADFDPAAWDRDDWQAVGPALRRVVLSRVPAASIPLSPHDGEPPVLRMVVTAPPDPEPRYLQLLNDLGVRGVRFALDGTVDPYTVLHYADHLVLLDWHIEFVLSGNANATTLADAEWVLTRLPVPTCFSGLSDFISVKASGDEEIARLLDLIAMGRFWLKASAREIANVRDPARLALQELLITALAVRSDRVVWGSGPAPASVDIRTHVSAVLDMLQQWIPEEDRRLRVAWSNPAILYRF